MSFWEYWRLKKDEKYFEKDQWSTDNYVGCSSIRFLIDSEGLGGAPNKPKCILCVQMHCLPSCEYRIDGKLKYRKNKANKRRRGIKLYIELALKRLKRFSNIKPFSSVSFYFATLNGIWCSQEQCNFWKSKVGMDKSPVFGERNLISSGLCLD